VVHQVPLNGQVLAVLGDVLIAVLKSLADDSLHLPLGLAGDVAGTSVGVNVLTDDAPSLAAIYGTFAF